MFQVAALPPPSPPIEVRRDEPTRPHRPTGPGWFDSSWDLHRGLDVREGWSDDDRVDGWIEDFLTTQRTIGRTASPSSSTAIA